MMAKVTVDFETVVGTIKAMHAVGQPPFFGMDFSCCQYLDDAHIPYARLHDVGGKYGGNEFVDIPNIFRDFAADENDPASCSLTGRTHWKKRPLTPPTLCSKRTAWC